MVTCMGVLGQCYRSGAAALNVQRFLIVLWVLPVFNVQLYVTVGKLWRLRLLDLRVATVAAIHSTIDSRSS